MTVHHRAVGSGLPLTLSVSLPLYLSLLTSSHYSRMPEITKETIATFYATATAGVRRFIGVG